MRETYRPNDILVSAIILLVSRIVLRLREFTITQNLPLAQCSTIVITFKLETVAS